MPQVDVSRFKICMAPETPYTPDPFLDRESQDIMNRGRLTETLGELRTAQQLELPGKYRLTIEVDVFIVAQTPVAVTRDGPFDGTSDYEFKGMGAPTLRLDPI